MEGCKPISTSMVSNVSLSASCDIYFGDPTLYRSIVRALQYITLTKLDLSFVVNMYF